MTSRTASTSSAVMPFSEELFSFRVVFVLKEQREYVRVIRIVQHRSDGGPAAGVSKPSSGHCQETCGRGQASATSVLQGRRQDPSGHSETL